VWNVNVPAPSGTAKGHMSRGGEETGGGEGSVNRYRWGINKIFFQTGGSTTMNKFRKRNGILQI